MKTPREPGASHPNASRKSRGSVTAETAVMLPALMVVVAAAIWAVQVVETQLECVDAARAAARAAARGEPLDQVRTLVRTATRPTAQVTLERGTELTKVEITVDVTSNWTPFIPTVSVTASATSTTEP